MLLGFLEQVEEAVFVLPEYPEMVMSSDVVLHSIQPQRRVLPVPFQPVEHLADAAGRQRDAGVGGSVIKPQRVAVRVDGVSAWKDDVVHVAKPFVVGFGAEHPGVAAAQTPLGRLKIHHRQSDPVEAARGRLAHPMIDHQPPGGCFDGRNGQPDLAGIPPCAAPGAENQFVASPVPQIGGIGNPDVSALGAHRPVDQRPVVADPVWKQSRVLVFRRENLAIVLEGVKIFGQRQ